MKKGCQALAQCEEMVGKLGLFSTNESKEDISTTNLKYILVIVNLALFKFVEFNFFDCSSITVLIENYLVLALFNFVEFIFFDCSSITVLIEFYLVLLFRCMGVAK